MPEHSYFRGQIVLRDMSGIFPPPSPTEYLFLEGGQPLNHKISLRHPFNSDVLFTLFAWDDKDGALHHDLLHTACTVVAGNRHDGYLSASRPIDDYFHVPDDHDYPVVLTFVDWWFPVSLPPAWLSASTGHDNNAAQATTHSNFSAGINMTGDVAKCLLLCSNFHKSFDDRVWVLSPKGPDTIVAHFLEAASYQAALYHNVVTHPPQCEPRSLDVRFAWAIMSLLRAYLSKSTSRKVKVWVASENDRSVGTEPTVQSTVTGLSLFGDTDDYSNGDYIHSSSDPQMSNAS
ncbi:hypothetical protein D6C78_10766 [Aureobasidium pullulans]|uniref:HNH nuclease domain-containing protein n=1 Tax=Aureobasidium pullulans TaxID=5580 RepID=A0A4T0B9T8_AURPU|nr:hypothetical protein D6C78_10766 [Aureobasidium pullulans]